MPDPSIIVIGAGLAGLSAGCYGRMNGYSVRIIEQDTRPGGLVTAWERKGYTIHGNMAFVAGSGPGLAYHRMWRDLGVVPKTRFIEYDHTAVFEGRDGRTLFLHNDLDKLERHMKDLSPEDAGVIEDFLRGARVFARFDLPVERAMELLGPLAKLKLVATKGPLLRAMTKGKKIAVRDFARRFKSPLLRDAFLAFPAIFSEDVPLVVIQAFLAWGHLKSAGFPAGGALEFSRSIAARFAELGGQIEYRERVVKILIRDGRAVGVRLADGREMFSDVVVSAADGRRTIFDLLEGTYADAGIRKRYRETPVSTSVVIVGFGVARSFPELPWSTLGWIIPLEEPVAIGGKAATFLRPMIYNFDPTLAPPGKTFVRLYLPSDFDYWDALRDKPGEYKAEKEKIAATTITLLDKRYPGFASQVEMWDVATPLTFERYTGNWKAASMGWEGTRKTLFKTMSKTLPGLKNFFMAGQWVEPAGGLPMVAKSGRDVIQLLCKRDGKRFAVSVG